MQFILVFCHFTGICGQIKKTKIDWFEAEELAVTGEEIFDYLKKDF